MPRRPYEFASRLASSVWIVLRRALRVIVVEILRSKILAGSVWPRPLNPFSYQYIFFLLIQVGKKARVFAAVFLIS